jgi:hypothetical protein
VRLYLDFFEENGTGKSDDQFKKTLFRKEDVAPNR